MKPDKTFVEAVSDRMFYLLRQRAALSREDLEYLVERTSKLRDERMQQCIAELIGWSDDDRGELETFISVALEIMQTCNTKKIVQAVKKIELRTYLAGRSRQTGASQSHSNDS